MIGARQRLSGRSELGVAGFLLLAGGVVLYDAAGLRPAVGQAGSVGPDAAPKVVAALLLITGVLLAIDVLRGGRGEVEGGEDTDLSRPADWRTMGLLGAAFVANILLIERAGWPISGSVLFFGAVYALGSRHPVRDVLIALAMGFGSYLLFVNVLGVTLPAGVLEGLL